MPASSSPDLDPFDPLGGSADPRRYVPLATFERLLAELSAKVRDGLSPILLTGPSGIGKTLLLRILGERERLGGQRVAYSPFFNLPPEDCARWLLHLLGIAAPRGSRAETVLLEDLYTAGSRPTLVLVDEIQAAPEASVRKLAALAQAGRPALAVVVAGSRGRALHRHLPALGPELTLRFPESLPDPELHALFGAILGHPGFSAEHREALFPLRDEIVAAASGLPRLLKAELEVRVQNLLVLRAPRRREVEELCLDTWQAPEPAPAAPSRAPELPAAAALPSQRPAELPRSVPPLDTKLPALASAAAPAREQVAELPRATAPQRMRPAAARETIGAWAGHALLEVERLRGRGAATARRARREADRLRVRSAVAARRASRAARARSEVALAWSTRAAGEADRLARRGARGAAAALGEAGPVFVAARRAALPAALLAALALFAPADHGSGTQETVATYRTAAAQPVQLLVPEPRALPGSVAEATVSLPVQVLAQINARPWARIRIDGVDVGPTPLSHRLAPGVYRIDAEFADGRSLRRSVAIGPEQRFVALP